MATASALEMIWTVVAVIGLLFSVWASIEAYLDLQSIRTAAGRPRPRVRIGGPRWWIALGNLVSSAIWTVVWVGFVYLGYVALRLPPNPAMEHADQTGWALVWLVILLAIVQAWNRYVRIRLRHFTLSAQERTA